MLTCCAAIARAQRKNSVSPCGPIGALSVFRTCIPITSAPGFFLEKIVSSFVLIPGASLRRCRMRGLKICIPLISKVYIKSINKINSEVFSHMINIKIFAEKKEKKLKMMTKKKKKQKSER